MRGSRWLRMRDVVTRHGDADGSGIGEGEDAVAAWRRRGGGVAKARRRGEGGEGGEGGEELSAPQLQSM
jgi:hypothetical protein